MSKTRAPYADEILNEPEPAGRDPWDAWRTAQKYGAPFWHWYVYDQLELGCDERDRLVTVRRNEGARAMKTLLDIEAQTLGGKALDLGCGPVSMLEGYPGLDVVAFDPSLASYAEVMPGLSVVGRVNNCDYRNCMIQDIPEEDFDLVWCYNVLDHAVDWQDILAHVYRVLKPGGELLLIVDIRRGLPGNKEFRVCHPLAFPVKELLRVLFKVGFKVAYRADIPEHYEEVRCWPLVARRPI